jgi:hypothetical protein
MSQAYQVDCPRCGMKAGLKCIYVRQNRLNTVDMRLPDLVLLKPHPARLEARRQLPGFVGPQEIAFGWVVRGDGSRRRRC